MPPTAGPSAADVPHPLRRADAFVRDRAAFVRGAAPGQLDAPALGGRARLFLHVLPLGREDEARDDLADCRWNLYHMDDLRPRQVGDQGGAERFGIDGYRVEYEAGGRPLAYVQHLRNGGGEYATAEFHAEADGRVIGLRSADATRGVLTAGAALLTAVAGTRQVSAPWVLYLSVYDLAGFPLLEVTPGWARMENAEKAPNQFERDALVLPPLVVPAPTADLRATHRALRPLADRLWQCAGYPKAAISGW